MTVKDVFELRRQGRIEEAYEAIRPMYAEHKGKYTSLAMFWVGYDVMKKRLQEKQTAEAMAIGKALLRLAPRLDDSDGRCRAALLSQIARMAEEVKDFRLLPLLGQLTTVEADWREQKTSTGFTMPPIGSRLLEMAYEELSVEPTVDNALLLMPLLEQAMAVAPKDRENLRCLALVYRVMGEEEKAAAIAPRELEKVVLPFDEKAEHLQMGRWGEEMAAAYLREKGYVILERNWRSEHRDIDIVARVGECVVFVEVKTRRNRTFNEPQDAVNYRKQCHLMKSINHYLKQHRLDLEPRFDIITIVGTMDSHPEILHLEDVPLR